MKNIISLSEDQRWAYLIWVFAPAASHIVSGSTITFLLFPALITISQYCLFRQELVFTRPALWFVMMIVAYVAWLKLGPFANEYKPDGIFRTVQAYYISQLAGSLVIPLMTRDRRTDRVLGWIVTNVTAMLIWLALYSLVEDRTHRNFDLAYFVIYPSISLIAHGLSGFLLFTKYTVS